MTDAVVEVETLLELLAEEALLVDDVLLVELVELVELALEAELAEAIAAGGGPSPPW